MKKFLAIVLVSIGFIGPADAAEITLTGTYYGKNLYVKNHVKDPAGYCTIAVTVNSKKLGDQINSSDYEINFAVLGINWGEKVTVKIEHKEDCKPVVINPDVLKPVPGGTFIHAKADKNAIVWTTVGETGPFPFQIQQYKWDRWVTIGEIMGEGKADTANYKFEVKHLNGPNVYRISQVDPVSGLSVISDDLKIRSANPVITMTVEKGNTIRFTDSAHYEIYNSDGEMVDSGEASEVDISALPKGEYFIGFGNSSESFKK